MASAKILAANTFYEKCFTFALFLGFIPNLGQNISVKVEMAGSVVGRHNCGRCSRLRTRENGKAVGLIQGGWLVWRSRTGGGANQRGSVWSMAQNKLWVGQLASRVANVSLGDWLSDRLA